MTGRFTALTTPLAIALACSASTAQLDQPVDTIFRLWSFYAYYGSTEDYAGGLSYKTGLKTILVYASSDAVIGLCSTDMGGWVIYRRSTDRALQRIESERIADKHGTTLSCEERLKRRIATVANVAAEQVLTRSQRVQLPDLSRFFRATPGPSADDVQQLRKSLEPPGESVLASTADCESVQVGKWVPEAGVAYMISKDSQCEDAILIINPKAGASDSFVYGPVEQVDARKSIIKGIRGMPVITIP